MRQYRRWDTVKGNYELRANEAATAANAKGPI